MVGTTLLKTICGIGFALLGLLGSRAWAQEVGNEGLRENAETAMRKAAEFFLRRVATRGGYVYYYSEDLNQRWGEGLATADQIWVQPPGTPSVGSAFLNAFQATGDQFYLEAATAAAAALIEGQLQSGGWSNAIDFDPRGKRVSLYRNGKGRGRNYSTLDDGASQAAMQLLMRVDEAHRFQHQQIHEASEFALRALLKAQFANGAFPQVWDEPVEADQPLVRANFPQYDWRSEGRVKNYWDMYTLNDGLAGTVADTLIDAQRIYQDEKYLAALQRLGDFLILAQLPEPQPAWAQQYDYEMHPIWARKFEPAAVTGGESQDVMRTLMKIYRCTGEKKYLEPIPRALEYLERSLLADGQLARYYELKSNKPLYMTRNGDAYALTYDDADLPKHYGWKRSSQLASIEAEFDLLNQNGPQAAQGAVSLKKLERQARQIVKDLDEQGRWISVYAGEPLSGQPKFQLDDRFISSAVFSQNLERLSQYLAATQ